MQDHVLLIGSSCAPARRTTRAAGRRSRAPAPRSVGWAAATTLGRDEGQDRPMARTNDEVARLLEELAELTELDEGSPNAFRVRAYQNAERAVRGLSQDVATLSATELAKVKGIGKSIAARIREYVDTGAIGRLEELRTAHPPEKVALLQVPGLGPKTVQLLDEALGIRS